VEQEGSVSTLLNLGRARGVQRGGLYDLAGIFLEAQRKGKELHAVSGDPRGGSRFREKGRTMLCRQRAGGEHGVKHEDAGAPS